MKPPKVTVVIPAYNHERYVGEAIRSVLDQTFQDFELIIINDGSTDRTEAEILQFKDERIRYYSQENRGLSATLNRGIDLARGEFFSFLPSDDLYYPDKTETQIEAFQESGGNLGMVFTRQTVVDSDGNEILDDPIIDWFKVPYQTKEEIFPALFDRNFLAAPTFMGKTACFEKVGRFDEGLHYCQDYDMWLRMLKFYDIRVLDEQLVRYRWHGKNLTYAKTERADFERAVLLLKAYKTLDLPDIFPALKEVEEKEAPEEYAVSYQTLARHLLKSGLIELVPVAYHCLEEAWKRDPSLDLEDEMESLIRQRPHFLDLRDERLAKLDRQVTEQKFKLNRLYQLQKDIEERSEELEKRSQDLQREGEDLQRRIEDSEKQQREEWGRIEDHRKELDRRSRQVEEREKDLHRWSQELLAVQEKWDRYLKKPHIQVLRFSYRLLKLPWKSLPESVRKPVRSLLKEKLLSPSPRPDGIRTPRAVHGPVGTDTDRPPALPGPVTESTPRVRLTRLKQPKVSVVLPVYNHSHLIEGAIRSVLNQTYPNLELIIVNDGSTDRANEILPRYAIHDRVLLLQQENLRLPRALTNGFRYATGTFLTWTSADNLMLPHQVETLVEYLLNHPDADMVYSNVEIIDDAGNPALNSDYRRHNQCPPGSNRIHLPREVETLGAVEDNFINASFLYRASIGKVIGEYDPCLLGTEDYDYWLRINSLFRIRHLDSDEVLYQYRVHADSLSERFGKSDIFENAKKLIRYNRDREVYYRSKFDIFILADQKQKESSRYGFLAEAFRNQGQEVTWVNPGVERPGEVAKKIQSLRPHPKAMILLTGAAGKVRLEELKKEDLFIHADMDEQGVEENFLKAVDAVSARSQFLLKGLGEETRGRSHLIRNGIVERRLLRKARDNFYLPHEFPWNSRKNLAYAGHLTRERFDSSLFQELASLRRDWNFMLIGSPGEVDRSFVDQLVVHGNVHFMGETPFDESGTLHQSLSAVTVLWSPIPKDRNYEERAWELVEMASLSGRPLLLPLAELDLSEIPFAFHFRDVEEAAGLLDRLASFKMDYSTFDQWLSRNTWEERAKGFLAIANNGLYYRKTREPIKKEKKLLDFLPRVYHPSDGKINVLVQARSLDKGGLEEVIFNLISHFDYRKINVIVLCEERGGAVAGRCRDLGTMVKVLGEEKEKEYQDILKKYSIGLVNPHYATFGLKIARDMGIPVVPVLHNTYVWFDEQETAHFKSCDPYVSQYIAVSENVARYTVNRFGIRPEKVRVISNGLDVTRHQAMMAGGKSISRRSLGIGDEDFLFLNIASYDGRKGHHALLSALKRAKKDHPEVKVLCVGNVADPGYYAKLRERIAQEGFEKDFILHDYVEDVASLYFIADTFILPSLIEGWSISVMEAMFYGLPLILTDVGGNRKIIEDVGNGIVVPTSYGDVLGLDHSKLGQYCSEEEPRNGQALAEAMNDFLNRRTHWKQMGERGKEAVQDRYSIGKTARAYENLFLSLKSPERTDEV